MGKLLKRKDVEMINQLIEEFEEKTHAELSTVIINKSDPYPAASLRFGLALAFIATFITSIFVEMQFDFMLPTLMLFLTFLFSLIGKLSVIQKWTITNKEKSTEVPEKALETFYHCGPNRTTHRGNILLFFSVVERQVCIVGDRLISDALEQDDFDKIVQVVQEEFSRKQYYEGIETAIETLERTLSHYFPEKVLEQRPNELANQVLFI